MRLSTSISFWLIVIAVLAVEMSSPSVRADKWQDESLRATLKNDTMEATFQAGLLVQLRDHDQVLINLDPASLPKRLAVFGPEAVDLDTCAVEQKATAGKVETSYKTAAGDQFTFVWSIEPGKGDVIAQLSAQTAKPVDELRLIIPGADIEKHALVWVDVYGVGHSQSAPWGDAVAGDPNHAGSPGGYIHPLVALFQGEKSGFFFEGRNPEIGPSALMMGGTGEQADLGFVRRFAIPTKTPKLYEVRVRSYSDHWQDAVDPYVNWMEKDAGYVPLEKQNPKWVRDIQTHAYIRIGDFDTLENLAKQTDASRTYLGRMVGAWIHPMDIGYPDYTLNETAKKWIKRARELGFHVGVHFNTAGISKDRPDLIERFKDGLLVVGRDENGNVKYQDVDGPHRHVYCSTALKAWREYLIRQIKPAIDAGVDVVYLDESMAAMGNPYVDGMTAIQGVMTEEKEIKAAYPQVAIETEQFNPMSARHASFALSQMPLGHPLGGYIFHRFINIVAEGVMGQPDDSQMWDAFASFGFMLPCGDSREDSWLQIVQAFQKYDFKPDSRLPRHEFLKLDEHLSHGLMPHDDVPADMPEVKLFGYRGVNDSTAFFQRAGNRRGLVIYEQGKDPRWVGTRIANVKTWSGPGVLRDFVPGSEVMVDWMIYSGNKQLALDPTHSYVLNETATLPQDRFHVTAVPDDFGLYQSMERRIEPQYVGPKAAWFKLNFSGHGEMTLHVPEKILAFLDGQEVKVDRQSQSARITVDAAPDKPSTLLAFEPSNRDLVGRWVDLPWHAPPAQRSWYLSQLVLDDVSADGPVRMITPGRGFWTHTGASGMILGTFPQAKKIRLQGGFAMREESFEPADAVIRINGKQVARVSAGARPFQVYTFDADVTPFAGQPVFLEFSLDGIVHGAAMGDWINPQILVER